MKMIEMICDFIAYVEPQHKIETAKTTSVTKIRYLPPYPSPLKKNKNLRLTNYNFKIKFEYLELSF